MSSSIAKERLQQFEGKTGFGSDDYHGTSENDRQTKRTNSYGGGGSGGNNETYDTVVNVAQDFAQKFASQAAEDISSLKNIVNVGSSKLGDFLQDIQSRYG